MPILGSFGITGWHDEAKIVGPGVAVGRSGASFGVATYCETSCWPLNTALYVEDFKGNDPRFVYNVLDAIDFSSFNSGAAQPSLNRNYLGSISVWRPRLDVQQLVAQRLGAFDDLIESNRRRIEILEEMARLLYREWFVCFRYPGHEDVEFVASNLGSIPEGWSHTCLADELELQRFSIKPFEYPDEEFQHYSIPAFDDRRLPSLELGPEIRSGKYLLSGESVMVSKLNPQFPRVWRVDHADHRRRAVASTEFLVLTNPDKWTLCFVYGLVTSTEFANRLATTASGTSTSHQRVKPADVMNMTAVSPPIEVVQRFSSQVRPILKLADNLLEQVEVLRKARCLLLPRLVSGELDVYELDLGLVPV